MYNKHVLRKYNKINGVKMSLFNKIFLVLGTLLFVLSINIFAKENLTLMTEHWPPLNYVENDVLKGPSVDIVNAIQNRLKMNNQISVYPWKRAYNYMLNEKNNMLFSMIRSQKREKLFKWVGPIAEKKYSFYSKSNFKFDINSLEDTRKFIIGVQRGSFAEEFLTQKGFENVEKANSNEQFIQMFNKNRFDLMLDSYATVKNMIKELNLRKDTFKEVFVVKKFYLYMAFNKDTDDSVIIQWQKAYDELYEKGKIKEIYMKYNLEGLYWHK